MAGVSLSHGTGAGIVIGSPSPSGTWAIVPRAA
jgi:hypothetical protein